MGGKLETACDKKVHRGRQAILKNGLSKTMGLERLAIVGEPFVTNTADILWMEDKSCRVSGSANGTRALKVVAATVRIEY